MIRNRWRAALTASALLLAQPASAAWLEAQTDHFIIDADTNETALRTFATQIERFDSALRRLYNVPDDPAGRANRVTVFAVNHDALMRICRHCSPQTAGIYHTIQGTSLIVAAALGASTSGDLEPQIVLLHEYAHHFMFTSAPGAYPRWYIEGFAEFNSNVRFRPDGGTVVGLPAQYRAYGLLKDTSGPEVGHLISHRTLPLSVATLLDPPRSLDQSANDVERFYGRSWLLMHYLELSPDRRGQLASYVNKFNHGTPSLTAGQEAFGDLDKLGLDLSRYLDGARLYQPLLVPAAATPPVVKIAPLSPGAAAMMPYHMQSAWGTTTTEAKAALPAVVSRAASFADDPRVQVELAEAAFDAGDNALAEAAATRSLAADPAGTDAMLYKGRAGLAIAMAEGGDPAKITAARGWIIKANRAAPDAALPLIAYYQSFLSARQTPSAAAINGLMRAAVVAPESPEVRWWLAGHMLTQNDAESARQLLEPIAFSPHASADSPARKVIELIDAKNVAAARKMLTGDPGDG